MMKHNENIQIICSSLATMGLVDVGESLQEQLSHKTKDDMVAIIALVLKEMAVQKSEALAERLIKRSRMGSPSYMADLWRYEQRELDLELIEELNNLHYIREKRNLVIWGAPGTGKTWLANSIATSACKAGIRTRWVKFPVLYRELVRLKNKDSQTLESKIEYYAKFQLLCIDEFPNTDIEDNYLLQEFFDRRAISNASTLVCSQSNPEYWQHLFPIKSFGESIKGRLLQNASRLEMKGPDLRLGNTEE
jgi:DNA replication protein DnaC